MYMKSQEFFFFRVQWISLGRLVLCSSAPRINLMIIQTRNLFIEFGLFLGSKDWPWQLQLQFVSYGSAYLSADFQEHI